MWDVTARSVQTSLAPQSNKQDKQVSKFKSFERKKMPFLAFCIEVFGFGEKFGGKKAAFKEGIRIAMEKGITWRCQRRVSGEWVENKSKDFKLLKLATKDVSEDAS